jgi:hypothetical protein
VANQDRRQPWTLLLWDFVKTSQPRAHLAPQCSTMPEVTITSVTTMTAPETVGNSAGSGNPPIRLDSAERQARRYYLIEFLAWARSVIKFSEIQGGEWPFNLGTRNANTLAILRARADERFTDMFDVTGITSCWQDYVLNAFHTQLEAIQVEGDLQLYGLDKPEVVTKIEQGKCIERCLCTSIT